jgi:type VI secretion system secreted protein Hcp
MAIYATIKGKVQGSIKGGVTTASFQGQIHVDTVDFGVGVPTDVASGRPIGKRVAKPLQITKPMDQASPCLHQACVTNEVLTEVNISWVVEGQDHKAFTTVKLTNAIISSFGNESSGHGSFVDKVSFTYTKIEFTWIDGGITSTDDWTSSS